MPPIKVSVIGSCRARGPVDSLAREGKLWVTDRSALWFTHSTRDALQKIDIVTGRKTLKPSEISLVVRGARNYFHPETHGPAFYKKTDCFVVEICSVRCFESKGLEIQIVSLNELLVKDGISWPLFLELLAQPPDKRDLSRLPKDVSRRVRTIVAHGSFTLQTSKGLMKDLDLLREKTRGKALVLIPHVNVKGSNGRLIAERSLIAKTLKAYCQKNGLVFFDPVPVLRAFGRKKALADINHYQPAFVPFLGKHLFKAIQKAVAPYAPAELRRKAGIPFGLRK